MAWHDASSHVTRRRRARAGLEVSPGRALRRGSLAPRGARRGAAEGLESSNEVWNLLDATDHNNKERPLSAMIRY